MKKLISTGLSLAMAMSACSTKTYAWTPTDFDDPKCIDVRKLGVDTDYITKNNVCGCKTCIVDAFTYSELEQYIIKIQKEAMSIGEMNPKNKQSSINWEAGKYTAINLVLITDTIGALFHSKIRGKGANLLGKVIYWGVMTVEGLVGILCQYKQNSYELILIKNKVRLNNIELILQDISKKIELKTYRNRNFLLVSYNNDPNSPTATAQFAKKDDIFYNESFYTSDKYFNEINEEKIKPLLSRIENGEFLTYKKHEYDTKFRDLMKKGLYYTVPLAIFVEACNAVRLNNPEALQKIKSFLKGKISKEKMKAFFREIKKFVNKGDFKKEDFLSLGVETVSIFVGDEKDQIKVNGKAETKETVQTEKYKPKDL